VGWFAAALTVACALAMGTGTMWLKSGGELLADVAVRVADVDLAVPSSWLRSAGTAGPVERLDLIVPLPALVDASAQEDGTVFVTLSRPNGSMDPADRTALLYARFLSAEATPSVADGLIRREFRSGTPYVGEFAALGSGWPRLFGALLQGSHRGKDEGGLRGGVPRERPRCSDPFRPGGSAVLASADARLAPARRRVTV